MTTEHIPQRNPDAALLARFIDQAVAGRPQGFRRDDLQAAVRGLEEQNESLDRAVIALALETPTGLCWCPRWYRERHPESGYSPHHETCARLRGLVSTPPTQPVKGDWRNLIDTHG